MMIGIIWYLLWYSEVLVFYLFESVYSVVELMFITLYFNIASMSSLNVIAVNNRTYVFD